MRKLPGRGWRRQGWQQASLEHVSLFMTPATTFRRCKQRGFGLPTHRSGEQGGEERYLLGFGGINLPSISYHVCSIFQGRWCRVKERFVVEVKKKKIYRTTISTKVEMCRLAHCGPGVPLSIISSCCNSLESSYEFLICLAEVPLLHK